MDKATWNSIADKIRSVDPETRVKGLLALKATLQLTIAMIDSALEKEGGHNGKINQTDPEQSRIESEA